MPDAVSFVLGGYAAMSVITFIVYGVDKRRAARGGRRTPESTLHGLAAAGGWPGALVGQRVFRHKTRKAGFQVVFWLTSAAHAAFWIWWWQRGAA